MFNDAGVEIYAFKPDNLLGSKNSDADINYAMKAGKVLGASHVTLELPGPPYGPKNPEHTLRLGKLAEKNGIAAYFIYKKSNNSSDYLVHRTSMWKSLVKEK